MRIEAPPRREGRESVVPMINVVFLLLIFFLMTARIAPPEPLEVSPPEAQRPGAAAPGAALHVSADGSLAYEGARGEAVFAALAAREGDAPLRVRADARLEAAELARVLARLSEAGLARVELAAVRQ
ncbi:MAG: ExbD/TolR family protein [Pseudomonadota bacterium]